jgi:hypothetical protein
VAFVVGGKLHIRRRLRNILWIKQRHNHVGRVIGLLQDHKQAWRKKGYRQFLNQKSERDTSSNEEQSEVQSDSTSSKRQQQIVLLKEGVHNLQNASSTIKEVKNLGNKRMTTRTPDQVLRETFLVISCQVPLS